MFGMFICHREDCLFSFFGKQTKNPPPTTKNNRPSYQVVLNAAEHGPKPFMVILHLYHPFIKQMLIDQ